MSEELYDVVFFGILQPGKDKETVMQNMATLFKTDAAKLAPYFAGGRKVIKGRIGAAAADKYKAALENVGLVIKIEPVAAAQAKAQAPASTAAVEKKPATAESVATAQPASQINIDTGDITVAPVGADVLEHPVEVPAQEIEDISDITMAETGADVLEHPPEAVPQKIDDISDITMAEPGVDVLENPPEVVPQKIDDISDLSLAEAGVDIIENPQAEEKAKIPDTSELSLDNVKD
ncbi:MAG: hypothetical protein KJN89_10225 [Gammaproteobacteria bacterium]|nr:hypothetical protein [Gammaproteobacteria bacterium]NNJ50741.1 hypothetical protein [Gammaproteobacteria bacterium]